MKCEECGDKEDCDTYQKLNPELIVRMQAEINED